MKKHLHLLLFFILPAGIFAQSQAWQIPVVRNHVFLNTTEHVVLDSLTITIPDSGKVLVRFDGNCISSPGDRIMLAASNYNRWNANDYTTAVFIQDSSHLNSNFSHTRVYDMWPGTFSFYAIGHNYIDYDGDGYATIDGKLTVEFVPKHSADELLVNAGIADYNIVWDEPLWNIDTLTVNAPTSGQILVSWDGYAYLDENAESYVTTSLEPEWPNHEEISPVFISEYQKFTPFFHRKIYNVEAGTHDIYAFWKKTVGVIFFGDDGNYSNLAAQFIPDNSDQVQLKSETIESTQVEEGVVKRIGRIDIEAPADGKVVLHFTGTRETAWDDVINLSLVHRNSSDTAISELLVRPFSPEATYEMYSISGFADVKQGPQTFDIMASFQDGTGGIGTADIPGLFTVQFTADAVTTATEDRFQTASTSMFYPNPTTGMLYSKSSEEISATGFITICNSNGQLISQLPADSKEIDLSHLPNGIYMISEHTGEVNTNQVVLKTGF